MSVKVFFISTIGTGILGNIERYDIDNLSEKYRELVKDSSRLRVDDEKQKEFEKRAYPYDDFFKLIYDLVRKDPRKYSPELNAFLGFIDKKYSLLNRAEVVEFNVYSTDTGTGFFCVKIVEKWLREELSNFARLNVKILVNEPVRLRKFGWGYEWFSEALLDMIDKIARVIVSKRNQGYKVYVNVTAGFKVETTYLTIISLLLNVDSIFYIHEATREVIELPILPLSIRDNVKKLLRDIKEPMRKDVIEQVYGVSVKDLEDYGIVNVWEGMVQAKEWIRKLLEVESEV